MEPIKVTSKAKEFDAIQFTGKNTAALKLFCGIGASADPSITPPSEQPSAKILMSGFTLTVDIGDYILKETIEVGTEETPKQEYKFFTVKEADFDANYTKGAAA